MKNYPGVCGLAAALLLWTGVREMRAQEVMVLRAARMLDVRAGRVVSPGLVVVSGDRMVSVGGSAPSTGRR